MYEKLGRDTNKHNIVCIFIYCACGIDCLTSLLSLQLLPYLTFNMDIALHTKKNYTSLLEYNAKLLQLVIHIFTEN